MPVRERITVGITQWLAVPGGVAENEATASRLIGDLAGRGADLVVLPELWVCGYDGPTLAGDAAAAAEPLSGARVSWLGGLARRHGIWLAAGSVPERPGPGEALFNTALLFGRDGELVAWHRKFRLYSPLGEDRVFAAGAGVTVCRTDELGVVGLAVCFDGDFPETARALRAAGADLVLLPSAYEVGARNWWRTLYPAHALSNGQWWVMANQRGANPGGELLGESQIISPDGAVIARASPAAEPSPRGAPGAAGAETLVVEIPLAESLAAAAAANGVLWQAARFLEPAAVQGVAEGADGGNQRRGHEVGGHACDAGEVPRLVFDGGTGDGEGGEERCPRDRGKQRGGRHGLVAVASLLAGPPQQPQREQLRAGDGAPAGRTVEPGVRWPSGVEHMRAVQVGEPGAGDRADGCPA